MVQRNKIGMWMLALTVAALTSPFLMFSQNGKSQKMPNLELRLQAGKLVNGIPESFTFVFVNISDHDVRMPQPSRCSGGVNGMIALYLGLFWVTAAEGELEAVDTLSSCRIRRRTGKC